MICLSPGDEGYNPDGELSSGRAPLRAKAVLELVSAMVKNQQAAPPNINVMIMVPQKKPVASIPASRVKVIEGGKE